MKILICYSSQTGNTRNVCEAVYKSLSEYAEKDDSVEISDIADNPSADYDAYIIGYWADKGKADSLADSYMERIKNKPVGIIATAGVYPDSDHARKVLDYGTEKLRSNGCTVLSEFICQGRICQRLKDKFKNLPEGHPHYMDEGRRKRHEDAESHPDENDREKASEIFRKFYRELKQTI
ncbi:MAG TPA: flavodoxin [Clostridiales bacterium]|nr:flavodoxin [Clostridiales bacterium]